MENSPVTETQLHSALDGLRRSLEETIGRGFSRFYVEIIEPEFRGVRSEIQLIRDEIWEIRGQIDGLYKKCEGLDMEYIAIKDQLKRIEAKLDAKDELPKLKQEIALLKMRVEDLERDRTAKS